MLNARKVKSIILAFLWLGTTIYAVPVIKKDYEQAEKLSIKAEKIARKNKLASCLEKKGGDSLAEFKAHAVCSNRDKGLCIEGICYDEKWCLKNYYNSCSYEYSNPDPALNLSLRNAKEIYKDEYSASLRLYLIAVISTGITVYLGPLIIKRFWLWLHH